MGFNSGFKGLNITSYITPTICENEISFLYVVLYVDTFSQVFST